MYNFIYVYIISYNFFKEKNIKLFLRTIILNCVSLMSRINFAQIPVSLTRLWAKNKVYYDSLTLCFNLITTVSCLRMKFGLKLSFSWPAFGIEFLSNIFRRKLLQCYATLKY